MGRARKVIDMQVGNISKQKKLNRKMQEEKIKIDRDALMAGAPSWLSERPDCIELVERHHPVCCRGLLLSAGKEKTFLVALRFSRAFPWYDDIVGGSGKEIIPRMKSLIVLNPQTGGRIDFRV